MRYLARASHLLSIVVFHLCCALSILVSVDATASNVEMSGNISYVIDGNLVVLHVDRVDNHDALGYSGTLHLELWAFSTPYNGSAQVGYKVAEYSLGQLTAGYYLSNITSGPIALTSPPDGTWWGSMILTEYMGTSGNNGYATRDYANFSTPVVIGNPSPPPPPAPPPPPSAVTPQVGLWWNPNESGSGYALDYKHGVLVVTVYSYAANGSAQWYLASGPVRGTTFSATLDKYIAGQCIACSYTGNPAHVGNDGMITIVFSSPTSATVYLPGNRVMQIQPQAF